MTILDVPPRPRSYPALANFKDKYIFCSSGLNPETNASLRTVDVYKINGNAWLPKRLCPKMRQARYNHSSCTLGDSLYVFCGESQEDSGYVETIEFVDANAVIEGWKTKWQLIEIQDSLKAQRY